MKEEHAEKLLNALMERQAEDTAMVRRLLEICQGLIAFLKSGPKEE